MRSVSNKNGLGDHKISLSLSTFTKTRVNVSLLGQCCMCPLSIFLNGGTSNCTYTKHTEYMVKTLHSSKSTS